MSSASAPASLSLSQALTGTPTAIAVPTNFEPWDFALQSTAAFNIRSPGPDPANPTVGAGAAFLIPATTIHRVAASRTAMPLVDGTAPLTAFILGLNNGPAVPNH